MLSYQGFYIEYIKDHIQSIFCIRSLILLRLSRSAKTRIPRYKISSLALKKKASVVHVFQKHNPRVIKQRTRTCCSKTLVLCDVKLVFYVMLPFCMVRHAGRDVTSSPPSICQYNIARTNELILRHTQK